MYTRILVATDGSGLSQKAVAHAIGLAQLSGAQIVAVHVVPRYPTSAFEGTISIDAEDIGRIERRWADAGQAIVDAAVARAQEKGVAARGIVTRSDLVAESLVTAARKHKCGLIVMASHGRKGLQRLLLGSEALHVLTHSQLPVLVLR